MMNEYVDSYSTNRYPKTTFCSILVYITLICNFLILYGNALDKDIFTSVGTRVLVTVVFLYGVVVAINLFQSREKVIIDYVLLLVVSLLVVLLSGISALLNHYVQYMCFIMLPVYLVYFNQYRCIAFRYKGFVYFASIVYTLLFVYLFFSDVAYSFVGDYGIANLTDLTLGFANPNETAIYLMITFFVTVSGFFHYRGLIKKAIFLVASCVLLYFIWLTNCRAAILLSVLSIVLKFTKLLEKTKGREQKYVVLFPIVFAVLLLMFPSFFNTHFILDGTYAGARDSLYLNFLQNVNFTSALFGDFNRYANGNLHNSYLSIFGAYGIFVVIIYIRFLIVALDEFKKDYSIFEKYAYISFLCVILHGTVEGTFLMTGTVYAGLVSMLILLMMPDNEQGVV